MAEIINRLVFDQAGSSQTLLVGQSSVASITEFSKGCCSESNTPWFRVEFSNASDTREIPSSKVIYITKEEV